MGVGMLTGLVWTGALLLGGICDWDEGFILRMPWITAISFMLSTGFIWDELIPAVFYFGLFFRTIMDDSEISADEAPFLLSLVLDEDDNSLC